MFNTMSGKLKMLLGGLLLFGPLPAIAKGPNTALEAAALVHMEMQADNSKPREQCYLYTQLVAALMDMASRQVAAGEDEDARKTVRRIVEVTPKLERAADRDAKKLKDAEKMLSETSRRLKDLSRVAGAEEREGVRTALEKLDAAHSKILGLVFLQ